MNMDLESVYLAAVKHAEKDGVITQDERELLVQLRFDVDQLANRLSSLDDFSPNYLRELDAIKANIIQNAIEVAMLDGSVSDEEREILRNISESLDRFYP